MSGSAGVPGKAVALATAGGVLVWAAISNRPPVDVLKGTIGKPTSGVSIGPAMGNVTSGVRTISGVGAAVGKAAAEAAGAVGSGKAGALVAEARKHIGARYVWAKAGPDVFDCSGLVVYCLKAAGVADVPRFTTATFGKWAKSRGAVRVTPEQFRAGDIILRTGHMAIAVSNTRMIHAPNVTTVVKESDIYSRTAWWGWRLWGSTSTLNEA